MSLHVEWNGKTYDADAEEFTGADLELVKDRAGIDYPELVVGITQGAGLALRALFWLLDHRDDESLKFGTYTGPPMKVWKQLVGHYAGLADELGKLVTGAVPSLSPGSPGSPSSTAGTEPTS